MRTTLLSIAVIAGLTPMATAQTMGDALNNACTVTWIGLDFSESKFVPTFDFAEVDADPQTAILKWNNLLEQEPEKFDLGKALGITRCVTNTSFVRDANEGMTSADLLGRDPYTLDEAKIPDMVKAYKTEGDGIGVVFIVSTFDKTQLKAEFYVTFFNMKTKEVLHKERITGKPMGFGMRNFWAGAISAVLKDIKKSYVEDWRAEFK